MPESEQVQKVAMWLEPTRRALNDRWLMEAWIQDRLIGLGVRPATRASRHRWLRYRRAIRRVAQRG